MMCDPLLAMALPITTGNVLRSRPGYEARFFMRKRSTLTPPFKMAEPFDK